MSLKIPINTTKAPKALPAIPLNIKDGGVKAHTHDIIQNLGVILEAAGTSLENAVKVNVFLSDMNALLFYLSIYSHIDYWS
ncbi:unnamed protein product [Fusarium langsethiae]|nr:unnamed protein product [Fusarium langsethiae]